MHELLVAVWQVPVPLHICAGVNVEPVHVAPAHCVPATYSRQAPLPLHVPSAPQPAGPASVHWLRGSSPLGTLLHVPSEPAIAHDRQVPVQALPQQMPCAQIPELHCASVLHAALIGSRPQLPPEQVFGDAHSAVVVHAVRHAAPPHA